MILIYCIDSATDILQREVGSEGQLENRASEGGGGSMSCLSRLKQCLLTCGFQPAEHSLFSPLQPAVLCEPFSSCLVEKGKHRHRLYLMELGPLALSAKLLDADTPAATV